MIWLVWLLPLLALSPFFCVDVGPGWPSVIRDRFLLTLALSSVGVLLWVEPGFGVFWAVGIWHWLSPPQGRTGQQGLGSLAIIGAGIAVYLIARQVPRDLFPVLQTALLAATVAQLGLAGCQIGIAVRAGHNRHLIREAARGTMGNRVVLGCLCAMVLPLSPGWIIWLVAGGVLLSRSFSALVAAMAALLVLYPGLWWLLLGSGAVVAAWMRHSRPTPLDGLGARLTLARLCWGRMRRASWSVRLTGHGPGAFFRHAKWWLGNRHTIELFKHAHNDPVQGGFEWGAVGLAGLVIFAGTLWSRGGWGDPVTAALAAVAVNSLVQFPLHLPQILVPTLVLAGLVGR